MSRGMPILARSLQSTEKRGFQTWTDSVTSPLVAENDSDLLIDHNHGATRDIEMILSKILTMILVVILRY